MDLLAADVQAYRDRFEDRIRIDGASGCWNWTGRTDADGYARVKVNGADRGVHRIACEAKIGRALVTGEVVRHLCDNRGCVNPDHVAPGSQRENIADRDARGRQAKGEGNGRSKLTEAAVVTIRTMIGEGRTTPSEIARVAGVAKYTIYDIVSGRTWQHIRMANDRVADGDDDEDVDCRKAA